VNDLPHVMRRKDVVIGRKRLPWQKLWFNDIRPNLRQCSPGARGLYLEVRGMAQDAGADGTILIGEAERATKRDLVVWWAKEYSRVGWKDFQVKAREEVDELKSAGLLVWGTNQVVYVWNWMVEQSRAPSPAAERQRRHREQVGDDNEVDGRPGAPGAEVPCSASGGEAEGDPARRHEQQPLAARHHGAHESPPPPPSAASTSTRNRPRIGFDSDHAARDMSHHSHDSEPESDSEAEEKERYNSSDSDSDGRGRPSTAAEGGGGGDSSFSARLDIYAMHPVDACCHLTGERSQYSRNGYAAALTRVGREEFVTALAEFRQARLDGITPKNKKRSWGIMFHGILNRREALRR
jgi:hypothetical protein